MSFTNPHILPNLYDALATPPISPTTAMKRLPPSRLVTHMITPHPTALTIPFDRFPNEPFPVNLYPTIIPLGSLMPGQLPIPPRNNLNRKPTRLNVNTDADSLTREKKGKMPVLSHLLSVGNGVRVLSLAADGKYVYAGCQSGDNEIVVRSSCLMSMRS